MNTLQINRHQTVDLSPKEALRAHIDQLSLEMQREFVNMALQLIAMRPALSTADITPEFTTEITPELVMEQSGRSYRTQIRH